MIQAFLAAALLSAVPPIGVATTQNDPSPLAGDYPAINAIDSNPRTAWTMGIGDAIIIQVPDKSRIKGVRLLPGYAKSAKLWSANVRITKVAVRLYQAGQRAKAGAWATHALKTPAQFPGVKKAWVAIDFPQAQGARAIEIKVLDVDKTGAKYPDICLSEVEILGEVPANKGTKYRYVEALELDRNIEFGDRLEFEFDAIDLDACLATHEYTGGAFRKITGKCKRTKTSVHIRGTSFLRDGGPEDAAEPPQKYVRKHKLRFVGDRLLVVDGVHLFAR